MVRAVFVGEEREKGWFVRGVGFLECMGLYNIIKAGMSRGSNFIDRI